MKIMKFVVNEAMITAPIAIQDPTKHQSHGGNTFRANGATGTNKIIPTIWIGKMSEVSSSVIPLSYM